MAVESWKDVLRHLQSTVDDPKLNRFRYLGVHRIIPAKYSDPEHHKLHHHVVAYENGSIDSPGLIASLKEKGLNMFVNLSQ